MSFLAAFAELLRGASTTLSIALGAWIVGAVIGLVLSLTRSSSWRWSVEASAFGIVVLRSLPQLIMLYLVYYGLGGMGIQVDSLLAAILALGIVEAAFMAEYFRAGFLTISEGQRDAGLSLGLSRLGVYRHVVIPEAIPFLIPPTLNSFVGLLKRATLASAVGAPEIIYRGQALMTRNGYVAEVSLSIIILYVSVTLPLTHGVALLEKRAQGFRRSRTG